MGILDQLTQMKNQGIGEEEIISELQQQGISPKAINDAISQSQIKNAVSAENEEEYTSSTAENPEIAPPEPITGPETYKPQTQDISDQQMYSPYSQDYPQQQEAYQPEEYAGYSEEPNYSDTTVEVAEQVFSEKIKKFQKQINETREFKTLAETKIEYLDKRLHKIETIIDKLQIAILEKIGSYGNNLHSIKKEMSMMQDSFGKMLGSPKPRTTHKKISHKTKKSKK